MKVKNRLSIDSVKLKLFFVKTTTIMSLLWVGNYFIVSFHFCNVLWAGPCSLNPALHVQQIQIIRRQVRKNSGNAVMDDMSRCCACIILLWLLDWLTNVKHDSQSVNGLMWILFKWSIIIIIIICIRFRRVSGLMYCRKYSSLK